MSESFTLPEYWWRDKELLRSEIEEHGGPVAAGSAHGVSQSTLSTWWRRHGFDPLSSGGKLKHREPGTPVDELEILRERCNQLEKLARGNRKAEVADEALVQRLELAVKAAVPKYKPPARAKRQADTEYEFVALFSDTHASEIVSAEETEGLNSYSWDVMLDRMARFQRSIISFAAHRPYPITKLHVFMLGDMLSGDIHDELAITNDRPTAEACIDFAYDASAWLEEFVPVFGKVEVTAVPGNHPRAKPKPAAKEAHNNADWISYRAMELYHRNNPAIKFNLKRGAFHTAIVCNRWRFLLMHGDGIRSTMPGVPWGGVVRRITTLEQQWSKKKQPLDYVAMGHFHTANTLDGVACRTFLNGSVKGPDEYSLKQFGSGRDAAQLLLTLHPRRGVTDVSYIDLQEDGT